jgi:hypothetical protein
MPETGLRPSPVNLNSFTVAHLGQDVCGQGKSNQGNADTARVYMGLKMGMEYSSINSNLPLFSVLTHPQPVFQIQFCLC